MGKMVLAGVFTLAASTALAQVDAAPEPGQTGGGGPANLCQELLAFMEAPPPEAPASTAAPAQASTAPAPEGKAAAAGGEASAPASGQAVPAQPAEQTQSAQEASGQTGPAVGAPEQNSASAEESKTEKPELKSSLSAPVPTDSVSTPKDSVMSLAEAEKLARGGDIAACQAAARELRLAGVAVPPPLLALTALDLKYQQTGRPGSQAPEPAPGQQEAPAPPTGTE